MESTTDQIAAETNETETESVFASPWDGSDMVLIVEDHELHVHKWILSSQSPVFKAMFNGHFKEASQDKVTLKEKEFKSMLEFLKLLYPSSMFGEPKSALDNECWFSVLALAEEYQCVNLIKQCIDNIKITPKNVLQILPYAMKYHTTALPKFHDIINWGVATSKLEQVKPKVENKEIGNFMEMLLNKCGYLESSVVELQDMVISVMSDFLRLKEKQDTSQKSGTQPSLSMPPMASLSSTSCGGFFAGSLVPVYQAQLNPDVLTIKGKSRCLHQIHIKEITKTKSCVHCRESYREKFIASIPSCQETKKIFDVLQKGDDVVSSIKEQK